MRTGRSLTVLCRNLLPGGCGIPACTEADTPLRTESQTPVKTLPWPNFVAAGNNIIIDNNLNLTPEDFSPMYRSTWVPDNEK